MSAPALPGLGHVVALAAQKKAEKVRKVRAPRFSDAEWKRLEGQALRLLSLESTLVRKRSMSPHEFVRVASMAIVELLEELPADGRPPEVWKLLKEFTRYLREHGARNAPASRKERAHAS